MDVGKIGKTDNIAQNYFKSCMIIQRKKISSL